MDTIEVLRYRLHSAINGQDMKTILKISKQLDKEIVKYLNNTKKILVCRD